MQDYGNPKSRNTSRAVGGPMLTNAAKPVGSNQTQGAGMIPAKVNVPLPGTNATQPKQGGGMKQNVPGFQGGIIPGKI